MNTNAAYLLFEIGIVFILLLAFAILFALSIIIRDVEIIKQSPFTFVLETFIVSLLPAVPILFFVFSRGIPFETAVAWLYGLSAKFAVFHVLFQISGFYTYMFS